MRRLPVAIGLVVLACTLLGAAAKLPAPLSRTLPNGLRVVVFQRPGAPIVQTQLQVAAGVRSEPTGHSGLAFLTAQLLRHGTTSRSAGDFAAELDTLGVTFAANVTRDVAQVAAGSRSSEFESALELISDAVVNPVFSEEAFEDVRRQIASQLGQQAQNPALLADDRAAVLAFGPHPYARTLRGGMESLLGATRDQVRAFHRDHWRPNRAVLAIAGDIDPERAFAAASEWFGRWDGRCLPEPPAPRPLPRRGAVLYDLPGSPVTEIRIAVVAPGRGAAAYPGWVVAREALAAGGLPAGTRVTLVPGRDASVLIVSASAWPESSGVAAGKLRAALVAFAAAPPRGEQLAAVRRRAAQAWPLSVETIGQWLATWLAGDAAGLPVGHLVNTAEAIRSADLASVAPDIASGFTLLLAGPVERMRSHLAGLGVVDTLAEVPEPGELEAVTPVTPEQSRRGKQLIAAAVLAHGGAAKLDAVASSELDGELRMTVGGKEFTGESRAFRQDPARAVYTTRFLEFEHRQVLDGNRGWSLSLAGDSASLLPADSASLVSLRNLLESDLVHLLRGASRPTANAVAVGKGQVDGKPCDRVEFITPLGLRTRLSLDAASHRIAVVEGAPTPQGVWRDVRKWSEYIFAEGLWWPRQEVREVDGERVTAVVLRHIEVNAPADSMLFRRPVIARGQIRGVE